MAWMKVETSVSRNRKFVQAGPGPSWLWICGLAYSKESLTDGFIPSEALPFLGVKTAPTMVKHLVSAGLWEAVEGGWRIHDYLHHNKSAADVKAESAIKVGAGHKGGKASGEARREADREAPPKQSASAPREAHSQTPLKHPAKPEESRDREEARRGETESSALRKHTPDFPGDLWWQTLIQEYPPNRVTPSHIANKAFIDALLAAKDGPHAAWDRMIDNLRNQKRGHDWRVKGMIPSLLKWLESGAWEQRHEEAPISTLVNDKTAGTLTAAAAAKRMHR